MSGLVNVDLGSVVREGGAVLDNLFTSDEERLHMSLQDKQMDVSLLTGQMEINKEEARHKSVFVAGWRSGLGWVIVLALAYKFLIYQFLGWFWVVAKAMAWIPEDLPAPPSVDPSELYPIVLGMLGLGGMRTYEGVKGVKTTSLSPKKKPAKEQKRPWYKRVFG